MPILRNIIAAFSPRDRQAERLYGHCVAVARDPAHYGPGRVADTVDGRFDLLAVHLFVAAHRLGRIEAGGDAMVRGLVEAFIRDMERNLREMGAGDIGVAKRIKYMTHALHGQMQAFGRALDDSPDALRDVLARTVLAGVGPEETEAGDAAAGRLAAYVLAQVDALAACSDSDCLSARCRLRPAGEAYGAAAPEAA